MTRSDWDDPDRTRRVLMSAGLLNEAMEALGVAGVRFEEVDGKPVIRSYYDQLGLEEFIGLLLRAIAELHLRRSKDATRLDDLGRLVRSLAAMGRDEDADSALLTEGMSLIGELRRSLAEPVLTDASEPFSACLTIGRDD